MNLTAAVGACCFFEKKTFLPFNSIEKNQQNNWNFFIDLSVLFSFLNHNLMPTDWRLGYTYFYPIPFFL
jgi:hypothetical protein